MRKMWMVILALIGIVGVVVVVVLLRTPSPNIGDRAKLERAFSSEEQHLIDTRRVTADELAGNDGKAGHKAWVAVNGVVYDMSGIRSWPSGGHHGVRAGTDATAAFVKSAHAVATLQSMKVIGGIETPR